MPDRDTVEGRRLLEAREGDVPWRKWGPYLSERQWGTVREDYSQDGDAWRYFTHDQARSRAYRWGEDGLAGFSDDKQLLCLALALWNGRDPILKERLFGLSNGEGNHGEDVKEYYYYLDSTPSHSYMKYLYRYPQAEYPYADLVRTNAARSRQEPEYELIQTGVFDEDRYFDVFVEYGKESPEDVVCRITAFNRGPEPAEIDLLPTVWFRNNWAHRPDRPRPSLTRIDAAAGASALHAEHPRLGEYYVYFDGSPELLFTENETNNARLFGSDNATHYVKDGINDSVVLGKLDAASTSGPGTKASAHYTRTIPAGGSTEVRFRLTGTAPDRLTAAYPDGTGLGSHFERVFESRLREADEFYTAVIPAETTDDEKLVARQALSGMLWTKQYYYFNVDRWLAEHAAHPLRDSAPRASRNRSWFHMVNDNVISMPDKWEYPWYAAWDLAFHTIALAQVDLDFAKDQLQLMLNSLYLHPNGQIPAYEWNFSDVNPPVHASATYFIYQLEKMRRGAGDRAFLESSFQRLLLNFTWWLNRKDPSGANVFEGGFLGLDNIGVFDRSSTLPTGGHLEQADGTAWMAMFCLDMLDIALELAEEDASYLDLARRLARHFLYIAAAMDRLGDRNDELWDEEDGFFYDVLRLPDGSATRLKVRSMVGLLPLCAVKVLDRETLERHPAFLSQAGEFLEERPELVATIADPRVPGYDGRRILSLLNEEKLRRVLARMLDEERFLSPYGVRSLSRHHKENPYVFTAGGQEFRVGYLPAESDSGMFGGNSNWRGPIWMPVNGLIVRALWQLHLYYGDSFQIECPTGSGKLMNLFEVAQELCRRLAAIFLLDESGRRPVWGGEQKFQTDPLWRDHLLFYEYFHGDNGAGLGASHQTGWTGLVGRFIQIQRQFTGEQILRGGRAIHMPELAQPLAQA
jgi:hypothetical protein